MTAINEIAGVRDATETRVREILATIKPLPGEVYRLTGEPLGVTGGIAEYVAAEKLGLQLAVARTTGYDALRGSERIQKRGAPKEKTPIRTRECRGSKRTHRTILCF